MPQPMGSGSELELVCLPGGMYQMGSPGSQGYPDEHPRHLVQISSFLMGRFPITQEQWRAVMGKLPACRFKGEGRPIDNVTWYDAEVFCRRLAKKTGRPYRLPSESEWEYACRAGTTTPFCYGETLTTDLANYCGDHTFGRGPRGIYRHEPTLKGVFPPNAFGLYDMHGNVWEWCADAWFDDYQGAPMDGSIRSPDESHPMRVARGGSWHETPDHCRSAVRLKLDPGDKEDYFGFRVAMSSL
jgi:formylglycine-generating enzyme required for sulfatase activity